VVSYRDRYLLDQHTVPRNLFAQMSKLLMFAQFKKDRKPFFVNLFLYLETDAVNPITAQYKTLFIRNESRASLWGGLVEKALIAIGGEPDLQQLYGEIEGQRLNRNKF
jgi:hypothetical protein